MPENRSRNGLAGAHGSGVLARAWAALGPAGAALLLFVLSVAIAVAAFIYLFLVGLSVGGSSTNFLPLSAFATVAAYRAFKESGLPLPAFASEGGADLATCLTAGSPTPGLVAGSPCLLPIGRPQAVPSEGWRCSAWRREVCNAVAIPEELYGNAAFRRAFDAYVADPCRFVADHRRLRDVPGAAPVLITAEAGYYARVIQAD